MPEIDAVGIVESVLIIARDITDRIKAEEEIRRKNILLENIIENNPIGMLIAGKDGNIIHYNRTVELIWGGAGTFR